MTEDEAKTKWCPFSQTHSNGASANRDNPNDGWLTDFSPATRCIGSDCMAWRAKKTMQESPHDPPPSGEGWEKSPPYLGLASRWVRYVKNGGYCGLAGKP